MIAVTSRHAAREVPDDRRGGSSAEEMAGRSGGGSESRWFDRATRASRSRRMGAAVGLGLLALLVLLDRHVEGRFQNAHIERPSVVFARPFEIVPRLHVEGSGLLEGLERMGYRRVRGANVAAGDG